MTRGDTTMKGILITNAFMRQGSFARMRELFEQAAQRAGVSLIPRVNTDFMLMPPSAHLKVDVVLFYDKDIRLAARLEAMGLPVFNGAKAIALCDDKTLTYLALQRAGVRQPDTVLCPQTFPGLGYGDMDFLEGVGAALSWPMVIKEGCGSFGEQVYLAQDEAQARDILHRIGAKPALFQRFIAYSAGRDRRLFVVGDRVIAAIERRNEHGDFRANIEHGGVASAYFPTAQESALALAACRALGLDFGGVDLLEAEDGPVVCEVNSNAHFAGLLSATGVNPADHIMQYIRRTVCEE